MELELTKRPTLSSPKNQVKGKPGSKSHTSLPASSTPPLACPPHNPLFECRWFYDGGNGRWWRTKANQSSRNACRPNFFHTHSMRRLQSSRMTLFSVCRDSRETVQQLLYKRTLLVCAETRTDRINTWKMMKCSRSFLRADKSKRTTKCSEMILHSLSWGFGVSLLWRSSTDQTWLCADLWCLLTD